MRRCSCGRKIRTKTAKVCRRCRRLKFKAMHTKILEYNMRRRAAKLLLQEEATP